jgi:hypothetical protein
MPLDSMLGGREGRSGVGVGRLCGDTRINRRGRLAQAEACLIGCGKGLGATRPYNPQQGIIPLTLIRGG